MGCLGWGHEKSSNFADCYKWMREKLDDANSAKITL